MSRKSKNTEPHIDFLGEQKSLPKDANQASIDPGRVHNEPDQITPLVKSLSGIIILPADYDLSGDYADYLAEKYQ